MTQLVVSVSTHSTLQQLLQPPTVHLLPDDLVSQLQTTLTAQPKLNQTSPAVPPLPPPSTQLIVSHTLLVSLYTWSKTHMDELSSIGLCLSLSKLVHNSHVYVPTKPVFPRSKQLESSLACIQRALEDAEYSRMTKTSNPNSIHSFPNFTSIAGTDPTLSLTQRVVLQTCSTLLTKQQEQEQWKQVNQQISVIFNVVLSVLATCTAAWWAAGSSFSLSWKISISLFIALLTIVAEVFLYSRYQVYLEKNKKTKHSRLLGFEDDQLPSNSNT